MTNTRALQRLMERLEEFLDEYKTELDADEASTVDDAISVIDRIKIDIESGGNIEDEDDYK